MRLKEMIVKLNELETKLSVNNINNNPEVVVNITECPHIKSIHSIDMPRGFVKIKLTSNDHCIYTG